MQAFDHDKLHSEFALEEITSDICLRKQKIQQVANQFWKRWVKEHLLTLVKGRNGMRNMKIQLQKTTW